MRREEDGRSEERRAARRPQGEPAADVQGAAVATAVALARTAARMGRAQEGLLAAHGLSEPRFSVLHVLFHSPGHQLPLSLLANHLLVGRSNITSLMDGLARDGLVERVPHPRDRRSAIARLTAEGEALVRRVLPEYTAHIARLLGCLDRADLERLTALLHRVELHLERQGIGRERKALGGADDQTNS